MGHSCRTLLWDTRFLESKSVWVVLSFCCEVIKAEKPNKVKCDAGEIEIFCHQEEPWCQQLVLLVAVSSFNDLPVRV